MTPIYPHGPGSQVQAPCPRAETQLQAGLVPLEAPQRTLSWLFWFLEMPRPLVCSPSSIFKASSPAPVGLCLTLTLGLPSYNSPGPFLLCCVSSHVHWPPAWVSQRSECCLAWKLSWLVAWCFRTCPGGLQTPNPELPVCKNPKEITKKSKPGANERAHTPAHTHSCAPAAS